MGERAVVRTKGAKREVGGYIIPDVRLASEHGNNIASRLAFCLLCPQRRPLSHASSSHTLLKKSLPNTKSFGKMATQIDDWWGENH